MAISDRGPQGRERPGASDIWRTWLVTGARAHPIDRRRMQGEHRGLKQILAEGGEAGVQRRPWKDFSRAMVRQSVNDAMGTLRSEERVVIRLAYFVGFSNLEIAEELGMTVRGVQRVLRVALDHLSDAMDRGKRAALALVVFLPGKRIGQWVVTISSPAATHAVVAAVVVGGLAVAPALDGTAGPALRTSAQVGAWQATPVQPAQAPRAPAATAGAAVPEVTVPAAPVITAPAAPAITAPAVPAVSVPVTIPKLRIKAVLPKKSL